MKRKKETGAKVLVADKADKSSSESDMGSGAEEAEEDERTAPRRPPRSPERWASASSPHAEGVGSELRSTMRGQRSRGVFVRDAAQRRLNRTAIPAPYRCSPPATRESPRGPGAMHGNSI